MAIRPVLGAPGIYRQDAEPLRVLTGVRMDIAAFAGVAPRGPARLPVLDAPWAAPAMRADGRGARTQPVVIESWQAYLQAFGGFEGPGRLPYAVSAFFANGGTQARVLRIVHDYGSAAADAAGTARGPLAGVQAQGGRAVWLAARDEGRWGDALAATLAFDRQALALAEADILPDRLRLPQAPALASTAFALVPGAVLRMVLAGGSAVLRRLARIEDVWTAGGRRERWGWLDAPVGTPPRSIELVEGRLEVADHDGRTEALAALGLSAVHPRWLARVLAEESTLLWPADDPTLPAGDPLARWLDADLVLDAALAPLRTEAFTGGADRWADIVPDDFFDPRWTPGDDFPGDGVHALADDEAVAMLVAPDLYSPGPLAPVEAIVEPPGFAGPAFAECVTPPPAPPQAPPPEDLTGLRLDPVADLDAIVALQKRLVDFADQREAFTVLLDVPPSSSQRRILRWRGAFDSAYAAAYHPWLSMAPAEDPRQVPAQVNPSAAAAGIVAQREHRFGIPEGPANALVAGAVGVADLVSPARHAELHPQAVNVFLAEREGVRLTAARTLSRDPQWRQLNVRRLVTMLRKVLDQQMQWAVFEPNDRTLRAQVARMLEACLRQLWRANAFVGATEAQAFFVRCDDTLNPPALVDQGRLLAQVGVAPAEPMEFIVLEIARSADATLTVEA